METYPLKYSYFGVGQSNRWINDTAIELADAMEILQNGNLMMAVIDFTAGYVQGDMLTFTDQNGIVGDYVATDSTGTLTLKVVATTVRYVKAMRSILFKASPLHNWKQSPTAITKTVRFNVTDSGGAVSIPKTRDIKLETAERVFTTWVPIEIKDDRK